MPRNKQIPAYPRLVKLLFMGYSLGFLVGTYTHVADLARHGFLAAPVPLAIGIFWTSLTLLDPLTAALLWWRPKAGIGLAVAIMVADVSINTGVYLAGYFGPPTPHMVPLTLLDQALFGLFVLLTAPIAYQRLPQPKAWGSGSSGGKPFNLLPLRSASPPGPLSEKERGSQTGVSDEKPLFFTP